MAMKAMATSKAMGTGRKAPTNATTRMPPTVAWAIRAWAGRSSMTRAPSSAARSIRGKATRKTYQKLLRKERVGETRACVQVSETGISMGQTKAAEFAWRDATAGAKTKISRRTVASLSSAIGTGKRANVMARTTTLSAGEANIAAR